MLFLLAAGTRTFVRKHARDAEVQKMSKKPSKLPSKKSSGDNAKTARAIAGPAGRRVLENGRRGAEPDESVLPSSLRGVMPIPAEVVELVAREASQYPMTETALQRLTDGFTLQFYFGGQDIAYLQTSHGKEGLAVGLEEIQ